jgi:hypothetical protein
MSEPMSEEWGTLSGWADPLWCPGLFRPLLHVVRDTESRMAIWRGEVLFAVCRSPVLPWSGPFPFDSICYQCVSAVGPAGLPAELVSPGGG